jgi:amino acid permease
MTEGTAPMFSRSEVLGGMPARRAASTIFAIENRTARLVVRSRRAIERYVSERAAAHQERAFLQALAEGREPPLRPSIQDIERHAPDWASLVPPDPSLRATVAHQLAGKYRFTRERVPRLRAMLGLEEAAVRESHERLFKKPLDAIYADRLPTRERWRWLRAGVAERLESLPPTWAAFALTLTETVGAGVLALPIALAGIGVLPAIALLIVFGLINLITIAALVESISRDGAIRYGTAYFGRLVEDYLGASGRLVLSVTLFVINTLAVVSYVIGFGLTLAAVTGSPSIVWVALLLGTTLAVLQRGSLDATVATAIVIGCVNIVLLLAIAVVGLTHADIGLLTASPAGLQAGSVALVFGVLLTAFFGHTSAATAAKIVLARDPTGRALMRGNVAAIGLAIVLYAFVVVGINGAVRPAELIGFGGTAIEPLARVSGPVVSLLGGAFVVLAMGLAAITCSLALYNQAREALTGGSLTDRWASTGPLLRRVTTDRLLASVPVILTFAAAPILLIRGTASFTGPIALLGTLATPILGGIFPMLMVLAARRRGEFVPADAPRALGHPITVAAIAGLFTLGIIVQGFAISQDLPARVMAAGVVIVIVAVCVRTIGIGAFRRRAVLEIRADERADQLRYTFVDDGHEAPTSVRLRDDAGERVLSGSSGSLAIRDLGIASFSVPAVSELLIWAHRVTDEGDSVGFPLAASRLTPDGSTNLGTTNEDGRLTLTLANEIAEIELRRPIEGGAARQRSVPIGASSPTAATNPVLIAGGEARS